MRVWLLVAMLLLGCSTAPPQPVSVGGRYASHLTDADVQEIQRAVAAYQKDTLRRIEAVARNKVRVETSRYQMRSWFPLIRRDGRWLVDETGEFETESTTILGCGPKT